MNAKQAKRERTKLRRTRETRVRRGPCMRCGGAGGWKGWPGFTCYRCGGQHSMAFETIRERFYTDPAAQALDDELTAIIEAERQAKALADWEAGRAERERAEREDAHEDALVADAERDAKARHGWLDVERGERIDVGARVDFEMSISSDYGIMSRTSKLVIFRDAAGNAIKTFGTGQSLWSLERGDRVTVRGTVKDFDTYEGERQTVLNRVKVTKEEAS